MNTRATGHGNGKTILIGEHHVMDGARALAIGLPPFRTDVTLTRGEPGDLRVTLLDDVDALVANDTRQMFHAAAQSALLTPALTPLVAPLYSRVWPPASPQSKELSQPSLSEAHSACRTFVSRTTPPRPMLQSTTQQRIFS